MEKAKASIKARVVVLGRVARQKILHLFGIVSVSVLHLVPCPILSQAKVQITSESPAVQRPVEALIQQPAEPRS